MPEKVQEASPPTGFTRLMFRAPIWLYRLHLGWLMGRRFLLLHHVGRKSGQTRQAVLEVAGHDKTTNTYFVASGFGPQAQWYQNIRQTPEVMIQVGRKKLTVTAVALSPVESGQKMVAYAHQHPKAAQSLMRLCGYHVDGTDEDYFIMGRDHIPFVAFTPQEGAAEN